MVTAVNEDKVAVETRGKESVYCSKSPLDNNPDTVPSSMLTTANQQSAQEKTASLMKYETALKIEVTFLIDKVNLR